jgi:hypothetical protein
VSRGDGGGEKWPLNLGPAIIISQYHPLSAEAERERVAFFLPSATGRKKPSLDGVLRVISIMMMTVILGVVDQSESSDKQWECPAEYERALSFCVF